jgi:hypothetical protein
MSRTQKQFDDREWAGTSDLVNIFGMSVDFYHGAVK